MVTAENPSQWQKSTSHTFPLILKKKHLTTILTSNAGQLIAIVNYLTELVFVQMRTYIRLSNVDTLKILKNVDINKVHGRTMIYAICLIVMNRST